MDISVYRKPTRTDRYLQYSSHHPVHARGAQCLFQRAKIIAMWNNSRREEKHLWKSSEPMVILTISFLLLTNREKGMNRRKNHQNILFAYLISENLRRVCRKYNTRTVFITVSTLRKQLTRVKDIDPDLGKVRVVYKISCECSVDWTTLERLNELGTHLKEHQTATRRGETKKCAIAKHTWTYQHQPLWGWARNNSLLQFKETFH